MTASSTGHGTESFPRVFVDTSAFYALEDASDRPHREARLIQRWCLRQRPRLFTTDHVIDESITLIGAHLRPARAVRFARLLLASRIVLVVRTDEVLDEAALNVYERLDDARLSFTDCVSFAVMRALEISRVRVRHRLRACRVPALTRNGVVRSRLEAWTSPLGACRARWRVRFSCPRRDRNPRALQGDLASRSTS